MFFVVCLLLVVCYVLKSSKNAKTTTTKAQRSLTLYGVLRAAQHGLLQRGQQQLLELGVGHVAQQGAALVQNVLLWFRLAHED